MEFLFPLPIFLVGVALKPWSNMIMILGILLSLTGCAALEMAQTWQLDRIRILGAKAEPAAKTTSKSNSPIRFISISPDINFKVDHNCSIPKYKQELGKINIQHPLILVKLDSVSRKPNISDHSIPILN